MKQYTAKIIVAAHNIHILQYDLLFSNLLL